MKRKQAEIERRKSLALGAINAAYNPNDEDCAVTLFISHHIEELEESYWQKHLKVAMPSPTQVLELLVLRKHWGVDENHDIDYDRIDTLDFTLPDEVTDYVLCVEFDEDGEVNDVGMES